MYNIEEINYLKAPIVKVYKVLTSEEGLGQVWTNKLKENSKIVW